MYRIQTTPSHVFVDSSMPHMNMEDFIQHYSEASLHRCETCTSKPPKQTVSNGTTPTPKREPQDNPSLQDEGGTDSLNSVDSGVVTGQIDFKSSSKTDVQEQDKSLRDGEMQDKSLKDGEIQDKSLRDRDSEESPEHCERCEALHLLRKQPGGATEGSPDLVSSLDAIDNSTGILHVLFLLLEGLAGAVSSCPRSYQPETLEMLFDILRSTADIPGQYTFFIVDFCSIFIS